MAASTTIVGFRPPDEKWAAMKAAWKACEAAGVRPPADVCKFFDQEPPGDEPGAEVKLGDAVSDWRSDESWGYEVDITKLPKDVRFIRFYTTSDY